MPSHSIMTLAEWDQQFSDYYLNQWILCSDSPWSAIAVEELRRRGRSEDWGPSVPTDRFCFSSGEPPEVFLTKVNGRPYRPQGIPWPRDSSWGEQMQFLCQFCFVDSVDLFPKLPGDVLVIFCRVSSAKHVLPRRHILLNGMGELFHYEWHPLGIQDLADSEIPPGDRVHFPQRYGVRYRGKDFLDRAPARRRLAYLSDNKFEQEILYHAAARHPGMKIGGLPFRDTDEVPPDAIFLASFWGVTTPADIPFPVVNRAQAMTQIECWNDENDGAIYEDQYFDFYLLPSGEVMSTITRQV